MTAHKKKRHATRTYHGNGLRQVHRTCLVRFAGLEARVDVQIASLVRELWRAGIATWSSCQRFDPDGDGRVWIMFPTKAALQHFQKICRPEHCEVRRVVIPQLWTLGTTYHVLFPPPERHAALRRLKQHNRTSK